MATPPQLDPFTALANPVRREILTRLRRGPCRAGDLARNFRVGRPAVSEHLQVLRRARLVREEPRGRERLYHLEAAPLQSVETWISLFSDYWNTRLDALEHLLNDTPEITSTTKRPLKKKRIRHD